jgi:hypothetical protein
VSGSQFGFGRTEVTCSASDRRGNTATTTFAVTVSPFTFGGFYQPVDNSTAQNVVLNTVKNGSTVPVKFKLQGEGGMLITDAGAISPLVGVVPCASVAAEDEVELTATGGTSLRYDALAEQFVFNWQTPKQPAKCYRVDVKLTDGSVRSAFFKLK